MHTQHRRESVREAQCIGAASIVCEQLLAPQCIVLSERIYAGDTQYIDIMFKRNLNRSISFVIMYYVTFLRSLRVVVGLGACAHDFVKMDVMFSFHAPNICIMYTPVAKLNYLHSCTRTCTCTRTHVYQFRSPVILIFP